jgi:D-arabinose 1-dehydrogenase-like Zn-dependent alcohol dehydrogenase
MVLGHEIEGVVEALGPDATGLKVGQRVAAFPWIGCGSCRVCVRGEENLCQAPENLGIQRFGGYAQKCLVKHERYAIPCEGVPHGIAGALMCSGLTAYSALKKVADAGDGDPVLIMGFGGVGMMAAQIAATIIPDAPIIVADVSPEKRASAEAAGFQTLDPTSPAAIEALVAAGGVHAALDFVGAEASFAAANAVVRRGGSLIVVGLYGGAATIPIATFPLRALRIQGSYVGNLEEAREVIGLSRAGKIAAIPLDRRPLSSANQALSDLKAGRVNGRVILEDA